MRRRAGAPRRWRISLVAAVLALGPATLWARQQGMVPFQGQQETVSAPPLVAAAYAFVWVALIAYVFLLWRRIGRVEHELADVRSKIEGRKPR